MPTTVLSRKALLVQGASLGYLAPKLAADAKSIDLTKVFANVTAANFKASKATIAAALADTVKGKLAADAKLDDYQTFLGAFDAMDPEEDKPKAKDADDPDDEEEKKKAADKKARDKKAMDARKAFDAKQAADRKAFDAENPFAKKDDDDKKADDEDDPDDKKKKADDGDPDDDKVTKAAMDAAIGSVAKSTEARIVARMRAARDAERFVRPWVGELAMDAGDTEEKILRDAAMALKIPDAATIHASALKTLIGLMPKPGEVRGGGQRLANDSVRTADAEAEFRKMFPEAGKAPRRV